MDRLENMRVFVRVAELKSFTKAADDLDLPRASVTTAIHDLEHHLGARLLNRTTRSVELTSDGSQFLERCRDLLSDVEETETMFRKESQEIAGRIRIDTSLPMTRTHIIPLIAEFLEMHPKIEIEVSSTDRRVDLVREGIDCVIRSGKLGSEKGLVEREIAVLPLLNLASREYIARYGKPRTLEDLRKHKLVHYSQNFGGEPDGFEYFDGEKYRELKMPGLITVNNTIGYSAACAAGLGIVQVPETGFATELRSGKIVEILPKLRAEPLTIKLVYQQRRMPARRVRVFIDWLEPRLRARLSK